MSGTVVQVPSVLHLRVNDRAELDDELERHVLSLTELAKMSRQGILITRYSPHDFVLELTADVPFGLTMEKQEW